MLIRRVIDDQLGDDADAAAMRLVDEAIEVGERAVARVDVLVIRDVVAVVAERRRVERQQPQRVDAEVLQVVELLGQPGEVADAVVRAVEERAHVRLVDDGVLVPERVFRIGGLHLRCASRYRPTSNSQLPTSNPIPDDVSSRWEFGVGGWELIRVSSSRAAARRPAVAARTAAPAGCGRRGLRGRAARSSTRPASSSARSTAGRGPRPPSRWSAPSR